MAQIFNNLLRRQIGTRAPTVEYLASRKEIVLELMKGWVYFLVNAHSWVTKCVHSHLQYLKRNALTKFIIRNFCSVNLPKHTKIADIIKVSALWIKNEQQLVRLFLADSHMNKVLFCFFIIILYNTDLKIVFVSCLVYL